MNFFSESENYSNIMVEIRRKLHMHPEVDRDLKYTCDLVCSCLDKLNIKYTRYDDKGILAEIGDMNSDNIIALRADMDALCVNDLKNVSYKSQIPGLMHACSHDAHTAIQLGAALLLKEQESHLKGRIRFVFQPAEETDGGARDMIEYGCLNGVKAIIGLHVDESLQTGTIGIKEGIVNAASNPFSIKVHGKGSHGAYPEDGVDAIMISSKIINNLQEVVSREISGLDNAVITIGKINGGTVLNAISSEVVMEGILRTLGAPLREFCKERIYTISKATAEMYRGSADVSFIEGYPSFENDDILSDKFIKLFKEDSYVKLISIKNPSLGVEDFAYYTQKVPGLYYKLGCGSINKGVVHPAHGSYFDIDEECLIAGCAVQSMFAVNLLNDL
jgi:amidohydrolase